MIAMVVNLHHSMSFAVPNTQMLKLNENMSFSRCAKLVETHNKRLAAVIIVKHGSRKY